MNSFNEIFEMVKNNITITEIAKKTWIDPIEPIALNGNIAILKVGAPFIKQVLEDNYGKMFKKNFKEILGFDVELDIICENKSLPIQKVIVNPIPELQDDITMVEKLVQSELGSNYKHTFDTFIEGESNRLAYSACKAAATGNSTANPIYIYSEPGLGKTHLLSAIKNELNEKRPYVKIVFTCADTFITDFVNAIRYGKMTEFKRKYRSADVLLIDDVQFFSGKEECQQELFNTFNELHSNNKQIVLTSDRVPKEIGHIDKRLLSRFEWGLIADIGIPALETRIAIIKRKANLYGLKISDHIVTFMAQKLKENIRQLEGAITKINSLSLVEEVEPTMSMAQNIVKEILEENIPTAITIEKVISEIASIYGFTGDELRSKKRSAGVSTARQIAIYVVHKTTGLSYSDIGKEFGGRDHSTVVYAVNKVSGMIKTDKSYRHTIDDLIKNVRNM